jgi:hypothetical protein
VKRVIKVNGMVNSPEGFGDQPAVINGFSDLMVQVFGQKIGSHELRIPCARCAAQSSRLDRQLPRLDHA